MKRNSVHNPANTSDPAPQRGSVDTESGLDQGDPLWDLLGEASTREPSAFFARNTVREARLMSTQTPSLVSPASRIASFFRPARLALGAAACAGILAVYQMWPAPDAVTTPTDIADNSPAEPSSALAELIIEESLAAAAEDPTIFTHDEVVAMIGF